MAVGVRRGGLCISETADLLGLSLTTIYKVLTEWSSDWNFPRQKHFVDRKRMARLRTADSQSILTQITTCYKCGEQKSILNAQHFNIKT